MLHGPLICSDAQGLSIVGKNKELQVFLFEQSIIFSEVVGKKTQFTSPQYYYKAHIQVIELHNFISHRFIVMLCNRFCR